ncbi:type II toxin-antitoxin system HicB family antitoxin [Leptolyngbya sp. 7M]|uniref:type II toxin-antitoxin system HicB family antitoxin n=1 Tax=Leptolyngbya sp. 7M TaxID=2812896 RepID=UPI001B8BCD6F|nr:type II toxin-antitoxin system HicB family antitoxin [Leptolyngbya sp. 7M]QYO61945.1 type II toxin-antitoxin system HicB family antitoxin [Leptolyngbya sp. 7M]
MRYKNYEAIVRYDEDSQLFFGEVVNTRDVLTFQGRSVAELKREMKATVEEYLELCRKRKEDPDRPFSGNFVLRLSPQLHSRLYAKAKASGQSLNSFVEQQLESSLNRS